MSLKVLDVQVRTREEIKAAIEANIDSSAIFTHASEIVIHGITLGHIFHTTPVDTFLAGALPVPVTAEIVAEFLSDANTLVDYASVIKATVDEKIHPLSALGLQDTKCSWSIYITKNEDDTTIAFIAAVKLPTSQLPN